MSEIKIGDVFRVLRKSAHYSIKGPMLEAEQHIDRLCNLLFVVDEIWDATHSYPIRAKVHPLYAQLWKADRFFDMFSEDEIEVIKALDPTPEVS